MYLFFIFRVRYLKVIYLYKEKRKSSHWRYRLKISLSPQRTPLMPKGVDGSCPARILGETTAWTSPFLGTEENLQMAGKASTIPSWGPEQPTVRHKPPGRQASLGLALTTLLVRHLSWKTTEQVFNNTSPQKSSTPLIPRLHHEIAGPSNIWLILTSTCCAHVLLLLEGGISSTSARALHSMKAK